MIRMDEEYLEEYLPNKTSKLTIIPEIKDMMYIICKSTLKIECKIYIDTDTESSLSNIRTFPFEKYEYIKCSEDINVSELKVVMEDDTMKVVPDLEVHMNIVRKKRNELLNESDYVTSTDFPFVSNEHRDEWLAYRQKLRDIPTTIQDVTNPLWPEKPTHIKGDITFISEDVDREKLKTTNLQERILVMEQAYHALLERVSDLENS
jgi:hypothetical protein